MQTVKIERQLCPKCHGQGIMSKPPYISGDVTEWTSSEGSFTCDVCNGKKLLPTDKYVSLEDLEKIIKDVESLEINYHSLRKTDFTNQLTPSKVFQLGREQAIKEFKQHLNKKK